MEEKLKLPDFDEWLKNYVAPEVKYLAAYDKETGRVLAVGPDYSIDTDRFKNTISIENKIAEDIITGEIRISKCFIDAMSGKLEITEVKNLHKIDDILHRIVEVQWSEVEKPDIFLTYNSNNLIVELSEEFSGTKKLDDKFQPVSKRNVFWDGETELNFLITDYNDPHVVYEEVNVKIGDLKNAVEFKNLKLPKRFSIYTRRLFKNYVLDIK
jgi:hypothetical protein